jgi:hypothetical protein
MTVDELRGTLASFRGSDVVLVEIRNVRVPLVRVHAQALTVDRIQGDVDGLPAAGFVDVTTLGGQWPQSR